MAIVEGSGVTVRFPETNDNVRLSWLASLAAVLPLASGFSPIVNTSGVAEARSKHKSHQQAAGRHVRPWRAEADFDDRGRLRR